MIIDQFYFYFVNLGEGKCNGFIVAINGINVYGQCHRLFFCNEHVNFWRRQIATPSPSFCWGKGVYMGHSIYSICIYSGAILTTNLIHIHCWTWFVWLNIGCNYFWFAAYCEGLLNWSKWSMFWWCNHPNLGMKLPKDPTKNEPGSSAECGSPTINPQCSKKHLPFMVIAKPLSHLSHEAAAGWSLSQEQALVLQCQLVSKNASCNSTDSAESNGWISGGHNHEDGDD